MSRQPRPQGSTPALRRTSHRAVFSGVAGAAQDEALPLVLHVAERVEGEGLGLFVAQYLYHDFLCLGALDGNLAPAGRCVFHFAGKAGRLLLNPGKVFVDVGGVHHQEEVVRLKLAVYEEVVHRTAVRIAHHAVEYLAGLEAAAADLIGKDVVDESLGLGALHKDLAHMGNVEHTHSLADGQVFLGNAAVLDGHNEACKGAHLGLQCYMRVIKTCLFL